MRRSNHETVYRNKDTKQSFKNIQRETIVRDSTEENKKGSLINLTRHLQMIVKHFEKT